MAISQRDRTHLHNSLEAHLGPDQAATLMELLPNEPASGLVTIPYFQTEMAAHRSEIRAEMADLRTELKGEMADLRTGLKGEMADLRGELKDEMSDLRGGMLRIENDFTRRMANMQSSLNRSVLALGTANVVAVVTALAT